MANKNSTKTAETSKAKPNSSTLSYDEYYATLMLAKKIRLENSEILEKAQTPKEKTKLLEQLFSQYNISTPIDSKEKEIATLLRINIFIPDNSQFIENYKNKFDKNVRLISDAYQVPAPFIFNKITEIGKYEKFLNRLENEGGLKDPDLTMPNNPSPPITTIPEQDSHTAKKGKTSKKSKGKSPDPKTDSPETSIPTNTKDPDVNENLLHHLESMQRYCTRLLDSNEQLAKDNTSLYGVRKGLEELIRRLRIENDTLKKQNNMLSSQVSTFEFEQRKLENKVSTLSTENINLKRQIDTFSHSRTIGEETITERDLRQKIKKLNFQNQELQGQLKDEHDKKLHYRNRAIVAEAQLEQLQFGMQGIVKEVDALDLSFMGNQSKKS